MWISCAPLLFFRWIVHPYEFLIAVESWLWKQPFWDTVSGISIGHTTFKFFTTEFMMHYLNPHVISWLPTLSHWLLACIRKDLISPKIKGKVPWWNNFAYVVNNYWKIRIISCYILIIKAITKTWMQILIVYKHNMLYSIIRLPIYYTILNEIRITSIFLYRSNFIGCPRRDHNQYIWSLLNSTSLTFKPHSVSFSSGLSW